MRRCCAAVQPYAELEFVNGGGTGSLHLTSVDGQLTELAGGSGLYGPTLFDAYRAFAPRPAMYLVTAVVRRPSPMHATVFSGGYVASGPPGWSRVPMPVWPTAAEPARVRGGRGGADPTGWRSGRPACRSGTGSGSGTPRPARLCERFAELNILLAGRGLALPNLGDIDKQTIAGAISTGTHGSGQPNRRARHPGPRPDPGHRRRLGADLLGGGEP